MNDDLIERAARRLRYQGHREPVVPSHQEPLDVGDPDNAPRQPVGVGPPDRGAASPPPEAHIALRLFSGVNVPPAVVALARGVGEAAALAGVEQFANAYGQLNLPPSLTVWTPVILLAARVLEGILLDSTRTGGNR